MEPVKKRRKRVHRQQLGDVPEVIQLLQLKLPLKDVPRTCILSKSWLHALSTSPAIRFCPTYYLLKKKQNQRKYMRWMHLTLLRYHRHNLPITSLDLHFGIHNTSYRPARKLIRQSISSSLQDLRLTILALSSFEFPDEIFSNENLKMLCLQRIGPDRHNHQLQISDFAAVRCTNLRVLELSHVYISEYVLNQLLSKNKLLEKIILKLTPRFDEIKVNNLHFLREVIVSPTSLGWVNILEFDDVPSLRSLVYNVTMYVWDRPTTLFKMCTIGSLRELQLHNVHLDDAFSNMIKSNFPFLEELTLEIKRSSVKILDITCLTLRKLMLFFSFVEEIKVQVCAPNLLTYKHASSVAPLLLFTTTPPKQIELSLSFTISINEWFFLDMREALKLSSRFNIEMSSLGAGVSVPFNIDDVRTIVKYPATNVEELLLQEHSNNNVIWGNSLLLDEVFYLCHPMYAKTNDQLRFKVANYFLNLIFRGVLENCEIRNPRDGRWVALTFSSLSLLDTRTPNGFYEFKLSWCSP